VTSRRAWGSLDRAQIVAAALELAKREGIEALSIRRLATEVGAARMALYRHVPDKDALLDLVANAVAEQEIISGALAGDGPWPDRLRSIARGMRRQGLAYPGLVELLMSRGNHGPAGLRLAQAILDAIAEAGLDDERTAYGYLAFVDIVLGRVHREIHGDPTSPERNEVLLRAWQSKPVAGYLSAVTPDQMFEAELDMFINALSQTC
jgi:AcrR family transcriptional regulator